MADLFAWSDEFGVGLQEIDEQHKVLVGLLNQLHDAVIQRHGTEMCRAVLNRLAEYTRTHFMVEESLMRILNYPGFELHKQQHEDLIRQVTDLQAKVDSGQAKITFELLHFLKVWLTHHILESDKRFGEFAVLRAGLQARWSGNVEETMKKKWSWKFW